MSDFLQVNALAIEELSRGNELAAQTFFRKNVKNMPGCLSLNNLGVFYCQYGIILKNGHIRSAKKVGLKYLLKASLYEADWRNYISSATALLESGDVILAYQYLLKAYTLNPDYLIQYNMGACLYRLERFQEAILLLEPLCTGSAVDNIIKNGGEHPFLILAYCQIMLHNERECMKYIQKYRDSYQTEELLDIFHLRYLCGMYEEALSECQALLAEWYPTNAILSLIIECISFFPSYAHTIEKAILPESKASWNSLKKSTPLRMQNIKEYSYLPPLIDLYQYIS